MRDPGLKYSEVRYFGVRYLHVRYPRGDDDLEGDVDMLKGELKVHLKEINHVKICHVTSIGLHP